MTPSVSVRWARESATAAQTIAAAINLHILSFDETEQAKLVEKSQRRRCCDFQRGVIMPRR
jgi:hypothetical protein